MANAASTARCPLCGGANDCARAARETGSGAGAGARAGAGAGGRAAGDAAARDGEAPCWCVARAFPSSLLRRADARDGGAACVCARCLDAASEGAASERAATDQAPRSP